MTFDRQVPSQLKKIQQWFGSIIGSPIDEDSRINPISPSGTAIELEAAEYIIPSPTLRPAQRIQIYNQQYWWRLLKILQEGFPTLTRLLGYYEFNRSLAIPYLVKYPPGNWSLVTVGDRLSQWVEEEYHGAINKEVVLNAVRLDWAFCHSFVAGSLTLLTCEKGSNDNHEEAFLSQVLYAQPHLHLFQMSYDGFKYRQELLSQSPEHWHQHGLPEITRDRTYFFALFRNQRNEISWKEIAEGEYYLLKLFQQGCSIDKACSWLEDQRDELCESALENLEGWFKEWTSRGWLGQDVTRCTG